MFTERGNCLTFCSLGAVWGRPHVLEMSPGLSFRMEDVFPDVANGSIDASKQGGIQALSLAITLGIAVVGGLIVGKWLRLSNLSLKNS